MSGKVGNPYRDPQTGKFTSGSGHNAVNSTAVQRSKGRISYAAKLAIGGAAAGVAIVGSHLAAAAIKGAAGPFHDAAEKAASKFIKRYSPKIQKAAAKGSKAVVGAVHAAATAKQGQRMAALKSHIAREHKAAKMPTVRRGKANTIPGTFPWKG